MKVLLISIICSYQTHLPNFKKNIESSQFPVNCNSHYFILNFKKNIESILLPFENLWKNILWISRRILKDSTYTRLNFSPYLPKLNFKKNIERKFFLPTSQTQSLKQWISRRILKGLCLSLISRNIFLQNCLWISRRILKVFVYKFIDFV